MPIVIIEGLNKKEVYMSSIVAHTEKVKDYNLKIIYDECAESPREWDNLGTMVCFHRRYNLGDKHNFSSPDEIPEARITLPLYLYDHSGITMSTSPFSCPWDSGQVGVIYLTDEKIKAEGLGDRTDEELIKYLVGEVETYDQYLRGDVYGYVVTKDNTCEHCEHTEEEEIDSCWGFFGTEAAIEEGKAIIKRLLEKV